MDSMARGFTPMLGSPANGNEKFAMDNSPDLGESGERQSGGVFGPFGGYHKTPSVEVTEENRSLGIEGTEDEAAIPDPEKQSLVEPPVDEHPALHPLPGVSSETPTYYPGGPQHPAYNTLPSQRGRHPTHITLPGQQLLPQVAQLAQSSPQIPDFEFSPVELLPEDHFDSMDQVPLTPQAELAAFPSPPKSIASKLRRHSTPPRNATPHRRSTPPRHSLPLTRLTPPPTSHPSPPRPSPPRKSHTGLQQLTTLSRKPTPLPLRPRTLTYPSPTAGGRPELPASIPLPVAKTPKNPVPAFHHISLPSPQEPLSASSVRRHESTNTTYSIPIGLGVESTRQSSWPLNNHAVTSDAHHLREQPSAVSALSAMRDLQNASAVSDLTTTSEAPEAELEGSAGPLKPNHSSSWTPSHNNHVMSWQNYSSPASPSQEHIVDEVSPMFSPPVTAGGNGVVSPMLSPPMPGQAGYKGFNWKGKGYEPIETGVAERLNIKVGLTPMIGGKKFSQRSIEQRNREYQESYGDLSIQPLNPGKRGDEEPPRRKWKSVRKSTY